jgi:hypothetical protein
VLLELASVGRRIVEHGDLRDRAGGHDDNHADGAHDEQADGHADHHLDQGKRPVDGGAKSGR